MVKKIGLILVGVILTINCLSQEVNFYSMHIDSINCHEFFKLLDSAIIGITPEVIPTLNIQQMNQYENKIFSLLKRNKVKDKIYIQLIINKKGDVVCGRIIRGNIKCGKELIKILKNLKYCPGKNKEQIINSITYLSIKYDKKNNSYVINY